MEIYDTIDGYSVSENDQIVVNGDYIEVKTVIDNDVITITGYSYNSGDSVSYEIDPFELYDLWSA